MNVVELDRAAVEGTVALARLIEPAALSRATPCGDWNLGALLDHMSVQHRGFAAAAAGRGANRQVWQRGAAPAAPVADYLAACRELLAAFAAPDVAAVRFALPEIHPTATFPAEQAISFHLVDYVVHGWDVARSIGAAYEPAPELSAAALRIVRMIPDGTVREIPGAPFAPALPVAEGSSDFDQVLLLLGRSPAWPG